MLGGPMLGGLGEATRDFDEALSEPTRPIEVSPELRRFLAEIKGQAPPNDWVELGKREGVNMEMEGQWNGQLKLAEAPPEGTAFVLYVSDEPLVGTEQRRQASQIQGVVE